MNATPKRETRYGILAERLLGPPPARIAADVEHGCETLVRADRPHLDADRVRRALRRDRAPRCSRGRSPAGRRRPRAPSARSRSPRGRSRGSRGGSPRRDAAGSRSRAAPTPSASSELAPEMRVTWPEAVPEQLGAAARRPRPRRRAGRPTHSRAAPPSPRSVIRRRRSSTRSSRGRDASRYGGSALSTTVNVRPRAAGTSRGRRAASAASCARARAPSRRSGG